MKRTVFITGATSGIGMATAKKLAANYRLILCGRRQERLDEIQSELSQITEVKTIQFDVRDKEAVFNAVESLEQEWKNIDILINNAGIAAFGKFLELEPTDWERIIQVNLMGTYFVTRAVLPNMIERQTGDIINISSTAGLAGNALTSAYSASKFAVLGLTDSLMQEVRKHNIRVTALTPSTVATDMAKELNLTDGNPDKVMQAEDISELIIAQLKLNRRVFIKNSSIWSTNP